MRAMFKDIRGRRLPGIIAARYTEARVAYDGQRWAEAATGFQLVLTLAGDPDLSPTDMKGVQDYKVLADGFEKLAAASAATQEAAKKVAEPPKPAPVPAEKAADAANATNGTPVASTFAADAATADKPVAPDHLYSAADARVSAPIVIRQDIPKWSISLRPPSRDGILELTIGSDGRVERATLTQAMAPAYDHDLLEATRNWRYEPARVDGRPVRYRKAIRITFQ